MPRYPARVIAALKVRLHLRRFGPTDCLKLIEKPQRAMKRLQQPYLRMVAERLAIVSHCQPHWRPAACLTHRIR
jgi:hypothetical protein